MCKGYPCAIFSTADNLSLLGGVPVYLAVVDYPRSKKLRWPDESGLDFPVGRRLHDQMFV